MTATTRASSSASSDFVRFEDFAPFAIEELTPRKQVRLRVRAVLGSRNLLLLIPTTVHTGWAESERFFLSEPGVIVQE